ncbi:MAG: glutamate--tRNA ligase [Candidatus Caldarchaeum sp.]|jgi:glutamyl-tRNA synthetase|uniref:Glutamate--tRNA ligase n=1 Tax=Caldiarchaeum subterraneum TaxID=311458 RepID=A0A7C4HYE0_CALS0|nr:glutamate--tRNA ligase [Candidatus Caldarchaeales archaeon]
MNTLRDKVMEAALRNAVEHGGKAVAKAVLSKILGSDPALRQRVAEVKQVVEEVVEEVNSMEPEAQKRVLAEKFGAQEPLRHRDVGETRLPPPLPGAVEGKVVTRLPPEPSGYMHLGHALAGLINEHYARRYGGKLWLRFEDTNPRKARLEFYESFRKGYRWLGIEWDFEKNNSDDMEKYYMYAERMIRQGFLYPCFCSPEEMHRQRSQGIGCTHRSLVGEAGLDVWEKALNRMYGEGEVSFRLVGEVSSPNTALRDPVMFRIVDHPHPLKGREYIVWPTYDFAAAVQDALCGVTHVLRSSEFAFRDELQNMIRGILGLSNPVYVEFSRFEFRGATTSKREIRSLIEEKVVSGWDDPRLSTIEAVKRRGILPQAIREFTLTYAGVTQAKKTFDWSLLHSINRKHLDPVTRRLWFVASPVKLRLINHKRAQVEVPYHPSTNMGKRLIKTGDTLYISGLDAENIGVGEAFRLKLLANVKMVEKGADEVIGEVIDGPPIREGKIIQWVPEDNRRVKVIRYGSLFAEDGSVDRESLWVEEGLAEAAVESVAFEEVVQFERYGFVRRDSPHELRFVYCHD